MLPAFFFFAEVRAGDLQLLCIVSFRLNGYSMGFQCARMSSIEYSAQKLELVLQLTNIKSYIRNNPHWPVRDHCETRFYVSRWGFIYAQYELPSQRAKFLNHISHYTRFFYVFLVLQLSLY